MFKISWIFFIYIFCKLCQFISYFANINIFPFSYCIAWDLQYTREESTDNSILALFLM